MELHQIRYFLALCGELNFTRAAEQCGVAQSSLTRAIKSLENELGGALFHRERANTHLSKLGQKVRPFLEQAYGHVEGAKRQAQDFLRLQTTSLRLGLMSTVAPAQLIALVAAMRARHPGIALQLADGGAQALQERLLGGELDVAIYALPGLAADERLNHLPLYREPFVVVMADTHRLARRATVRMAELAGEPYLWRLHCEHAEAIDAAFAQHQRRWPDRVPERPRRMGSGDGGDRTRLRADAGPECTLPRCGRAAPDRAGHHPRDRAGHAPRTAGRARRRCPGA